MGIAMKLFKSKPERDSLAFINRASVEARLV
jgi:hypothetical protein